MKVAFLVNDLQLSGGVGVVVQHARRLSLNAGWDVTLVMVRDEEGATWHGYDQLPHLHVCSREEARREHFDVAIATWWETTFTLFELSADRYAYFVQSLEDRFYHYDEAERLGAAMTLDLPVAFITEAHWIADTLKALRPDAPCHLVPNGIDKEVFGPLEELPPDSGGPLRVLIEGSPSSWFKHIQTAVTAAIEMREPHHVTVVTGELAALGTPPVDAVVGPLTHAEMAELYGQSDVVLKLSSVEGMFGPPLEGFHRGATCVVTPVTGHEEYVKHGWNGLVTDWDDHLGAARQLDLLARDRELLHFLRANALETARAWPSWEESAALMRDALVSIRAQEPPSSGAGAAQLMADLRAGLDLQVALLRERAEFRRRARRFERRLEWLADRAPVHAFLPLRRYRAIQLLVRPIRPLYRRARRRLSG